MTTTEITAIIGAAIAVLAALASFVVKPFRAGKALAKLETAITDATQTASEAAEEVVKLKVEVTGLREAQIREIAKADAVAERLGRIEAMLDRMLVIIDRAPPPAPRPRRTRGSK